MAQSRKGAQNLALDGQDGLTRGHEFEIKYPNQSSFGSRHLIKPIKIQWSQTIHQSKARLNEAQIQLNLAQPKGQLINHMAAMC